MVRTQIQLSEEQYRRLKKNAAALDKPIAEQIREAVDSYLQRQDQTPKRSVSQIAGKFAPKIPSENKSENRPKDHDDWFAESIAQRKAGRP
jgi:predicted transcriptional regulator